MTFMPEGVNKCLRCEDIARINIYGLCESCHNDWETMGGLHYGSEYKANWSK